MKKYSSGEIRFLALRTVGNFFVLASLFGMFMTFGPALKNEAVYRYNRLRKVQYVVQTSAPSERGFFRDIVGQNGQVQVLTPVDTDFGIIIPKIAANAKVIPNVDASNYNDYMAALKIGVAHALGTVLPGQGGNVYLFAHSTDNIWNIGRYNAVFYLLKELTEGDEVDLFYNGRRYIYIVSKKEIVDPSEVGYLTKPSSSEQLTLQTCWPPGTTLKRLIVIAKPVLF